MLETILPEQMKLLEETYMSTYAIPSILLMEQAAQGIVDAISRHADQKACVVFLCGPGANGGDGYAAARIWQIRGGTSRIFELSDRASGDAAVNRTLALQHGCTLVSDLSLLFQGASVIVDALFGTGLSRPLEGDAAQVIDAANRSTLPIIAVDIPSGLSGKTGEILGVASHCIETVTFHRPKTGLFLRHGPRICGKLTVHPILIPASYGSIPGLQVIQSRDLPALIAPRPADAHKGTYGRTLIFAGSRGLAGAAAMCARAAIRAGSGLTTLLCVSDILPILQVLVPQATCLPLPNNTEEACAMTSQALTRADRAVIGCGLSTDEALLPLLSVFRSASCPVIWDADALTLLSRHPDLLPLKSNDIITPHPGEAARLLAVSTSEVVGDPMQALSELRRRTGASVLLKGARTLMGTESGQAVNLNGTPARAKGGSGDLRAGILAALLGPVSGEDSTLTAMQCACYIHAQAAQTACKEVGEDCVTAEDILSSIRLR